MNHFYASLSPKSVFLACLATLASVQLFAQATPPCGVVAENFNNTNGTTAGFSSSVSGSTSTGFTFNQTGQNGFLERCNIPSPGTSYQIVTPTYQSFASQNAVGFGFTLGGQVRAENITVFFQYNFTPSSINSVRVRNIDPIYPGQGDFVLCDSVNMNRFQGFNPGDRYRFVIQITSLTASQNNQCIVFDNFRTTGTASQIPLPVGFTGLNARWVNDLVEVIWNVAGEREVARYEVERSTNGINFTKVGEVTAQGNTAYRFVDPQPLKGLSYYRIKNVDLNGSFQFSPVLRFNGNSTNSNVLQVYPNPLKGRATVTHGELAANARFSIVGVDGRILQTIVPNRGVGNTVIDLEALLPGVYLLRVEDGKGRWESTKFLKQ